jgi:hypothetical protein
VRLRDPSEFTIGLKKTDLVGEFIIDTSFDQSRDVSELDIALRSTDSVLYMLVFRGSGARRRLHSLQIPDISADCY